jgi:hypothetical protein
MLEAQQLARGEICIFYPRTFRTAQPSVVTYTPMHFLAFRAMGLEHSDARYQPSTLHQIPLSSRLGAEHFPLFQQR